MQTKIEQVNLGLYHVSVEGDQDYLFIDLKMLYSMIQTAE